MKASEAFLLGKSTSCKLYYQGEDLVAYSSIRARTLSIETEEGFVFAGIKQWGFFSSPFQKGAEHVKMGQYSLWMLHISASSNKRMKPSESEG